MQATKTVHIHSRLSPNTQPTNIITVVSRLPPPLAGNVGICVCRLHPPKNRHLCLSPTCQECRPDTSATFWYVGSFLGCLVRVSEFCLRHTFLRVIRNRILVDDLLFIFGRWWGSHHIISVQNCHGIVRDCLDLWPMHL